MRRYLWLVAMLIAALSLSSCARALVPPLVPAPRVLAEAAEITLPEAAPYRITFVSDRDGALAVYSMDLDGADVRRLTQEPGDAGEVSLSPGH